MKTLTCLVFVDLNHGDAGESGMYTRVISLCLKTGVRQPRRPLPQEVLQPTRVMLQYFVRHPRPLQGQIQRQVILCIALLSFGTDRLWPESNTGCCKIVNPQHILYKESS